MMSVNDLFYGNTQTTPSWIVGTSAAAPVAYYSAAPYYGTLSSTYPNTGPNMNEYSSSTYDRENRYDSSRGISSGSGRTYYNPSYDPYNSNYREAQRGYPSSNSSYSSNSRQHDHYGSSAGSWGRDQGRDQGRRQQSRDTYSSYDQYNGRGNLNFKGHSTVVELKVPVCCEACEDRVSTGLFSLQGVESVKCDQDKQKVMVRGTAPAADILKVCRKQFKRSELLRH